MKKILEILCTMAPWFFYWAGKYFNLDVGSLIAAIASMVLVCGLGWHRPKGPDWAQLTFFCLALVGSFVEPMRWAVDFQPVLPPALFVLMALGSLLIRRPFTIPYAMDEVPAHFWKDPGFPFHFSRVNYILTCLWTLVFIVSLACAWLGMEHAWNQTWLFQALPAIVFLLASVLTRYFPLWYQKKFYEPVAAPPEWPDSRARKTA